MYPAAGNPYHARAGRRGPVTTCGDIATVPVGPVLVDPDMTPAGRRRTVFDAGESGPYVDIHLG